MQLLTLGEAACLLDVERDRVATEFANELATAPGVPLAAVRSRYASFGRDHLLG